MSIFDSFKKCSEIKEAKKEIEKAKDNICSPKMKDICIVFADDIIKLTKKLNLYKKQEQYIEIYAYLELIYFASSIIIIAYHGDNSTLRNLYKYMVNDSFDKFDKRIVVFMQNMFQLIDSLVNKVWPDTNSSNDSNKLFYGGVFSYFNMYSQSLQKDELTGDFKYSNTLNNLIKNCSVQKLFFEDKLSESDNDNLIEGLYNIFLPFYHRCAEIFYPVEAMLKLYRLT